LQKIIDIFGLKINVDDLSLQQAMGLKSYIIAALWIFDLTVG
jgi:hypothetical protein